MDSQVRKQNRTRAAVAAVGLGMCQGAVAQSVFDTGINSFLAWVLIIANPLAVIAVIALGLFTLAGKVNWVWFAGSLIGIGIVFGSEQIVGWIRSMFGV